MTQELSTIGEDLIRFKKGTKRINRLSLLVHEGLVAQNVQRA